MGTSLKDLNEKRKTGYYKDRSDEDFFLGMNQFLQARESEMYRDYDIEHPFIFVIGLPRSGTTLISQLLAYSFDAGYINNLIARFWLAPVHGIRLSKSVLGKSEKRSFQSDYARTSGIAEIHEFGYFWRDLLNKETMEDIIHVKEREKDINWQRVKRTLANMQHEFDKPMVFKNIFGSYHLQRMREALGKTIYVFIERDPLDTAVSILDARRKYYEDLNTWWSYTPVEYDQLKDLDYWQQIAGQVFYLQRFYENEINQSCRDITVRVSYNEMCAGPAGVLNKIQSLCREQYQYELKILNPPPEEFPYRKYENRDEEKAKFEVLINRFREKENG